VSRTAHPTQDAQKDEARDERLAALLDELARESRAGGTVNIEDTCRRFPDLASDLRELWGAAMLADAIGHQANHAEEMAAGAGADEATLVEAPMPALELPCQLGAYELLEELGRGGMGVVYRAMDKKLGREAAVKMILRGKLASQADVERFRGEAQAAARLDHAGIVPVYDVAESDGQLFFSMRYIAGQTLSQRLAQGPLPPREAALLLMKVARAVHYAHRRGILHRDLKPSNILIDEKGEPHITDFGLAKEVKDGRSVTKTGAVLGTPAYMAPEQAAGGRGRVGPAADIYSLGSILYHMLTGRPPFQAPTPVDVVLLVLEQEPSSPRRVNPKADRDLSLIALRCLQKPPDLRYDSAAALADDLEAYLNDESISARSGRFGQVISRMFRETHNAQVLENWGELFMWNSAVLLTMCVATNLLYWWEEHMVHKGGLHHRWPYFILWSFVAGAWGYAFWSLRRRMGPVTFVERQVAHVWAAAMISIVILFPVEYLLDTHPSISVPVLSLSPVLALCTGSIFLVKASMFSGEFYWQAFVLYATALVMALVPEYAHFIFGPIAAACFFIPGLKYYRLKKRRPGDE